MFHGSPIDGTREVGKGLASRILGSPSASSELPVLTFAIALLSLVIFCIPGIGEFLAFDRVAVEQGEVWRLLTSHLTHWSAEHLFWDVLAFLILGIVLERTDRPLFLGVLLGSGLSISLALWFFRPEMTGYRGLSGVDSGLFAAWVGILLRNAQKDRDRLQWFFAVALIVGFIGKIFWELLTASNVFVDSMGVGVVGVPLAHLVGTALGGTLVILFLGAAPALTE